MPDKELMDKPVDLEKENLLPEKDKSLSMRDIRSLAFHFIYAQEQSDYEISLDSIIQSFKAEYELDMPEDSLAIDIAKGVEENRYALDNKIIPYLKNWKLERLGLCTRLILRMAIWELDNTETAPSIIINEAIELAKAFAEKDAYKFINGVLDQFVNKEKNGD